MSIYDSMSVVFANNKFFATLDAKKRIREFNDISYMNLRESVISGIACRIWVFIVVQYFQQSAL